MMKIVTILVVIFTVVSVAQSHRGRRYLKQELDVEKPRHDHIFTDERSHCPKDPCKNGGTCLIMASGAGYCACNSLWTGVRCGIATYNSKCVFPFKYQGVEYKKCTNVDGDGKYWCAFNNPYVMYSERLVGWDWCHGDYGPEYNQGITCDVPSIDHATTNCEANAAFGSTCEVTCDAGYGLYGRRTIICADGNNDGIGDYPGQHSCW